MTSSAFSFPSYFPFSSKPRLHLGTIFLLVAGVSFSFVHTEAFLFPSSFSSSVVSSLSQLASGGKFKFEGISSSSSSLCEASLSPFGTPFSPFSPSSKFKSYPLSSSSFSLMVQHASSSIVVEEDAPAKINYNDKGRKKTVVITGANSGIGLDAAKKLTDKGYNVYVVCRSEEKCREAQRKSGAYGYGVCDLSSLDSIDRFLEAWGKERPIDILVLNAGLAWGSKDKIPRYTKEGFEETVGVNHFGHFYLTNKLIKNVELAAKKNNFDRDKTREKARIVVTASSVHDPDTAGGDIGEKAGLGDLSGLRNYLKQSQFTMVDGSQYSADKTYKDSKLCNVFFTRELSRRINSRGGGGSSFSKSKNTEEKPYITVNCFSPGLIPTSGLFRAQNPIFSTIFSFLALNVLGFAVPVSTGGDCLTYMCESEELDNQTALFLATPPGKPKEKFGVRSISAEASDEQKQIEFWELSEKVLNFAKTKRKTSSAGVSGSVTSN